MLEAFIDINTGKIIVVKPVGSIWGRSEVNQVILIRDDELQAKMEEDEVSHTIYPYATYETKPVRDARGKPVFENGKQKFQPPLMTEISLVKIKVDSKEIQEKPSTKEGVLRTRDADTKVAIAEVIEVKAPPTKTDPDSVLKVPEATPDIGKPVLKSEVVKYGDR